MEAGSCEKECRICKDGGGRLIAPCRCKGSMGYVHGDCLVRWLKTRLRNCGDEFNKCEVCHGSMCVLLTGTDFFLFPYSISTHHVTDSLLIGVLVVALWTSTFVFILSVIGELLAIDLWNSTIRWFLTPIMFIFKLTFVYIWLTRCAPTPPVAEQLMHIFKFVPSVSELLYVSFLTTTRISCTAIFEQDTHPYEYRLLVLASAAMNYVAMALLIKRAFGTTCLSTLQ
eukprot:TRINITY_DN12945_c0_g1_i1.p1 TRINITY_DN12945_c0_g1~~TRINITY_DN12945_c0_g1_i1.p1  ORF type:complete len:227 (+),score=57.72 TRINITY_DN12945_c0_g1_i1:165-845(+)